MDVSTRWDSTCIMMVRAIRLRDAIDRFCQDYTPAKPFALNSLEWKKIGYLIDIVRPFNFFTTTIGKSTNITLPYVLRIYDELFERLNESRRRLKAKVSKYSWVNSLIQGIDAAEAKLDVYYNKTYSNLGSIYGIGALLDPRCKLESFDQDFCWLNFNVKDWKQEFEEQFRELYRKNYSQNTTSSTNLQMLREANMDPLARMLSQTRTNREFERESSQATEEEGSLHEIDQWFAMSKLFNFYTNIYTNPIIEPDNRAPLLVWKSLENDFPGLATMARDLLAIPMSGAGIERVFSLARDFCNYRRGQLSATTLRSLLLVYYSQIIESRTDQSRKELSSTVNITDMTEEEITIEIEARDIEQDLASTKLQAWDEDHYISDEEVIVGALTRTVRIQRRMEAIQRRTSRYQAGNMTLSVSDRVYQQSQQKQFREIDQYNRMHLEVYDDFSSDDEVNHDSNKEDELELPVLPSGSYVEISQGIHNRKRRLESSRDHSSQASKRRR